ncbi:hypothetical protein PV433_07040 [Paenibacillus sp. GYB004]|uniref:hypothetical protein n=1 Tax=Paenibacillus sp. GYB004 TaxID=2994393 RepID=UPI002F966D72
MEKKLSRRTLLASTGVTGAAMISGGMFPATVNAEQPEGDAVLMLDSVADISQLQAAQIKSGQMFYLAGWHPGAALSSPQGVTGGGIFSYDPNCSKSEHNGGTKISITVPFNGSVADYIAGAGETDGSGTGCLLRLETADAGIRDFGAKGGDASADTPAIHAAFAALNEVLIPPSTQPYVYDGILNITKSVRGTSDRPTIRCNGVLVENTKSRLLIENLIFNGSKDYSSASAADDGTVGIDFRGQHCRVDNVIVEKYYRGVYVDGWSNTFHSLMVRYCHVSLTGRTNMQNCHFDLFKSINCHALPDLRNSHGILFSIPQFQNYGVAMFVYQSDVMLNAPYFETHKQKPSNGMIRIGSAFEVSASSVTILSPVVNTDEPYIFQNSPVRPTLTIMGRRAEKIKIVPVSQGSRSAVNAKSVLSDAQYISTPVLAFGGGLGYGNGMDPSTLVSVQLGRHLLQLVFHAPDQGFRFSGLTVGKRYYMIFDWELASGATIRYDSGLTEQLLGVHQADGSRVNGIVELYAAESSGAITFADTNVNIYHFYLCESVQPMAAGVMKAYSVSQASGPGWQLGDLLVTAEKHQGSYQHVWNGTAFAKG